MADELLTTTTGRPVGDTSRMPVAWFLGGPLDGQRRRVATLTSTILLPPPPDGSEPARYDLAALPPNARNPAGRWLYVAEDWEPVDGSDPTPPRS